MAELKAFGRWGTEGIKVSDQGLVDFVTLKAPLVPRTGARYAKQKFYKSRVFIVERLMNKLMVPGHKGKKHKITSYTNTGKSGQVYKLVEGAFSAIEQKTKENPVKVFVEALENAAPREEIISIEYGGARYPKAVDCSPQRRIDFAIKHMVQGAYQKSFNNRKTIKDALAEEILAAYQRNSASNAISRKLEIERQADASR
ncbi:30S ribosomal protein S7 [Candidatus Woesearchaeota archaeon]|nr:30S ribosomal protein S7 [Candidatus Woesearchaeota archaeon]